MNEAFVLIVACTITGVASPGPSHPTDDTRAHAHVMASPQSTPAKKRPRVALRFTRENGTISWPWTPSQGLEARIERYYNCRYDRTRAQEYREFLVGCVQWPECGGSDILYGAVYRSGHITHVDSALGWAIVDGNSDLLHYMINDLGVDCNRTIRAWAFTEGSIAVHPLEFALFTNRVESARTLWDSGALLPDSVLARIETLCVTHCSKRFRALFQEYLDATQHDVRGALATNDSLRAVPFELLDIIAAYATHKLPPFVDRCGASANWCFEHDYTTVHRPDFTGYRAGDFCCRAAHPAPAPVADADGSPRARPEQYN